MSNKTNIFTCKEHYQAFRKAWSAAVNDDRAKKHFEPCDEWFYDSNGKWTHSKGTGRCKFSGWLHAEHMLLYNVLRDKPLTNGFVPVHKTSRIANGGYINHGFWEAAYWLGSYIKKAQRSLTPPAENAKRYYHEAHKQRLETLATFLEPFDGIVTIEMLAKVEIPEIKPLESNYKPGVEIAREILNGKRFTLDELMPLMIKEES